MIESELLIFLAGLSQRGYWVFLRVILVHGTNLLLLLLYVSTHD